MAQDKLTPAKIRQPKIKEAMLEQLRKTPIIQIACERAGLSRAVFYRWKAEDEKFSKAVDEAISEGTVFINELSESQIIALIKERDLPAIRLWLRHNHPKYRDKIEVDATIRTQNSELTPEQDEAVKRALKFAGLIEEPAEPENNKNIINNNQNNDNSKQQSTNGTKSGDGETATDSAGK